MSQRERLLFLLQEHGGWVDLRSILVEESHGRQRFLVVETAQEDGGDGTSRAEG